jgi:non-heme chloroperoxidase
LARRGDSKTSRLENTTHSAKLIKGVAEIYYPGLSHGLTATHADVVNRDLLAFCQRDER